MSAALRVLEIEYQEEFLLRGCRMDGCEIRRIANTGIDRFFQSQAKVIEDSDGDPWLNHRNEVISGLSDIRVEPIIVSDQLKACGVPKIKRRFAASPPRRRRN